MNKKIQLFALMIIISSMSFAQVGIGTTSPDASAALDISATDKGFLIPRMTTAQRMDIASPAMGLQVYDTETKSVWSFNDTNWVEAGGAGKFVDGANSNIAYYEGSVGIGKNSFADGVHKLYVESIKDTDGSNTTARIDATYEGTGTSATTFALGAVAKNNSNAIANYAVGLQGIAENSNAGGTINNAVGSWPQLSNSGTVVWGAGLAVDITNNAGTINQGYGQNIAINNKSGASMGQSSLSSFFMTNEGMVTGNAYGVWIGGTGAGSVGGNSYALYIATPYGNVTGDNFALYSENTAPSIFAGNIGIGDFMDDLSDPDDLTTPLQTVHVNGVMRLEAQAVAPSGDLGDLYVGTDNKLYFHNGTDWKEVQLAP